MNLNPSKCAFGVSVGKFLGFMVTQRGIKVSPNQIKVVMEAPAPRNKKELQRLIGKLIALGRFIARFTDKLRPFFLVLRKADATGWTDNCQISDWAVSAVLFRCPTHKEQKLVYYVSKAMADAETRYSKIEKTALALRSAAQKLRPYFQDHLVVILTDYLLRSILHKPDMSRRMLQWAIELSEYGIEYRPRLSMKGQVMADFVVESPQQPARGGELDKVEWWTLQVDGASRLSGFGVGLLLQSSTSEQLEQAIQLGFPALNNEAEYEALLSGLDLVLTLSVFKLRIYNDSQLVVRHVQEEYGARDERMT
ncbi:hypothetical protein CK203_092746 [Vitis vinifera]|uniref:Reverse transcriptase RNase H-like domain-containing protein n=1 Tax=Vitis vinifera TaxID=29760 RepID=A0A438D884_VITVI|nr:hypothetical protein CK203_092746 [Vitis vinifera]